MKGNILIVDDELDILEFLTYNLKKEGYEVHTATNGREGLELAQKIIPQLIVLDIMMPEMDGVEVCRRIRTIPELDKSVIAFLTAKNEDLSQINALEVGGDDYITKPIKPQVFASRIKALLRRTSVEIIENDHIIKIADIEIDKERVTVTRNNVSIDMPKKEFELLLLLVSKPGKVFTREEIYNKIWGDDVIVGDRTIDVHIRKLREKLTSDHIKTFKGIGYRFDY